jgi:hypothetical protein
MLLDGEKTLADDWHEEHPPAHTLIWKNCVEFMIFPQVPAPTSFAALDQMMAQAPAWPKTAVPSDDADSKPDSDTAWPIPEHIVSRNPVQVPSGVLVRCMANVIRSSNSGSRTLRRSTFSHPIQGNGMD